MQGRITPALCWTSLDPLAPFGYRQNLYSAALYGDETTENPLKIALLDGRNRFRPNRPAPAWLSNSDRLGPPACSASEP